MKEKKQFKSISGSREETNSEKEVRKKAFEQFQKENKELLRQRGIDFSDFSSRRLLYEVYSKYPKSGYLKRKNGFLTRFFFFLSFFSCQSATYMI